MKTQSHPNPPIDGYQRVLTMEEVKLLRKYRFPQWLEKRISDDWRSRRYPRTTEKEQKGKNFVSMISKGVTYMLPFLLWLVYLDPNMVILNCTTRVHVEDQVNIIIIIGIVISWLFVVLSPLIFIGYKATSKIVDQDPWNPVFLSIWKQSSIFRLCVSLLWQTAIVIGFWINSYPILASLLVVGYLLMLRGKWLVRNAIQLQMRPYV